MTKEDDKLHVVKDYEATREEWAKQAVESRIRAHERHRRVRRQTYRVNGAIWTLLVLLSLAILAAIVYGIYRLV